ncbi:MAG: hypothetical protein R6V14_03095 [Halanaerobiales bacterium]
MNRSVKTIIKDFVLKMFGSQQGGKDLKVKIEKENQNLVQDIIDYIMDKFNF